MFNVRADVSHKRTHMHNAAKKQKQIARKNNRTFTRTESETERERERGAERGIEGERARKREKKKGKSIRECENQ